MKRLLLAVFTLGMALTGYAQTTPTTQVKTVSDLVDLAIPTIATRLSAIVTGSGATNNVGGAVFVYNPDSTEQTNTTTVFKPTATTGRWVKADRTLSDFIFAGTTNQLVSSISTAPALLNDPRNPILVNAVEESFIMDGHQMDNWYRDYSNLNADIYYAYADNLMADNWTIGNGGVPLLTGYSGPFVFKLGATYYMTVIRDSTGNLHLYSSADKVTWAVQNSGNPILTKSGNVNDLYYTLHNSTVAVVGSTWHLLIEGKDGVGGNFKTLYSSSTLAAGPNFNTSLSALPVLAGFTGNAYLVSVPDRAALLTVYGNLDSGTWVLKAATALLSADLSLAASWTLAPGFGMQKAGVHLTDPTMVFPSNKAYKAMLGYNYAQLDGYRAYGTFDLNQFYDLISAPQSSSLGSVFVGNKVEANSLTVGPTYNGVSAPEHGAIFEGKVGILTGSPSNGLDIGTSGLAVKDAGNTGYVILKGFQAGDGNCEVRFSNSGGTVKWEAGMNSAIGAGFEINEGHSANNRFYIAPGGAFSLKGATTVSGGDLTVGSVGYGLKVKEGSNARMGTATLVGGTITVANTSVTASTRIFISRSTTGGTEGTLSTTQINATSFTVNSSSGTDTSTVNWLLIEPSP